MGSCKNVVLGALVLPALSLGCAAEKPELPPPASSGAMDEDDASAESGGDDGDGDGDGADDPTSPAGPDGDDGGEDGGDASPSACEDAAAMGSHEGCEFWAVDLPNAVSSSGDTPDGPLYAVTVANATSLSSARIEVFVGGEGTPFTSVEIARGHAHTFELPSMNLTPAATSSAGIAYRIESDVPVSAYQFNPLDGSGDGTSTDASLLLPAHLLGDHYSAVTGNGLWSATSFSFMGAFVTVVATEDDTMVDLFPTWHNLAGGPSEGVLLDRGQVFTALSQSDNPFPQFPYPQAELSGSRIVANKPVAVFSGNVATQEPITTCCADHLEEQLMPIEAWGTEYAVAPPPAPGGEGTARAAYRIVGAAEATELVYSPEAPAGAPMVIDAGETVRFEADQPFTVTSVDPAKPLSITQFLLSTQALDGSGSLGDPAMIGLPAREHFGTSHAVFAPAGFDEHYATIVREADTEVVAEDVAAMSGAAWTPLGAVEDADYELTTVPLAEGLHVVVCESPCAVVSVGYGEKVSYGYVAGLGAMTADWPPETGRAPAQSGM